MPPAGYYEPEELAEAKRAGRSARGMYYSSATVAGKKTAAVRLFKEPHHTSADVTAAKRSLARSWPVGVEISTYWPAPTQ